MSVLILIFISAAILQDIEDFFWPHRRDERIYRQTSEDIKNMRGK